MIQSMRRIIIIGPSGAGKTTLSMQLSELLKISHTELDSIQHQENWRPLDKEEFVARVNNIARQPEWIFCGNYFTRLGMEFWKQADTIIWCDYSFPVVAGRLFRRTLKRTMTREELWNGNREGFYTNFFTKESILVWMLRSWNKQKKRYGKIFSEPSNYPGINFVRLRSPRATRAFLKQTSNRR